ncbi:hypothetical protein GCM10017608_03310 [Agromyces luteolus]|uniref:DUF305 domain-containing protein n=1 Tax=Agromyces luteolus TaxID=88373 RepID=A0A7C9HP97_9MICO|nr:DUF305 domain-containing protein [Agromyces luteolus]MUN05849.1 DUF305 domain-containing protein [Agromyces luteolus]GLK26399.1 hypothetical protein GCM10017608_03310 [Agromyces luteolus]
MAAWARSLGGAAALLLALGLTACTAGGDAPQSSGPVVQLGAPGEENRTLSPEEAAEIAPPEHTEADVEFMQMMILHHDQAVTMTEWVDDRTDDRDLRLMAERMRVSQSDEIDYMAGWLRDRGTPLEGDHAHGGELMPGMLTDEQLEQLEAADGEEFERLFLEFMIQHHAGALEMVADLRSAGGGNEISVSRFAADVEGDQAIEIARMQGMLAELAS